MDLLTAFEQFEMDCRQGREKRRADKTLENYRTALTLLMKVTGVETTYDIESSTWFIFMSWGEEEKNWKPSTEMSYCKNLLPFFDWLVKYNKLPINYIRDYHPRPIPRQTPEHYSEDEVKLIFRAVYLEFKTDFVRNRVIAMTALLLLTGVRLGELLALKVGDINLIDLRIVIRADTSKSRVGRFGIIHPELERVLKSYLKYHPDNHNPDAALWISETTGRPLSRAGFKHVIERISKRLTFRFKPKKFRSTFGTTSYAANPDPFAVMQLMGHTRVTTTQIYSYAQGKALENTVNGNPMGRFIP